MASAISEPTANQRVVDRARLANVCRGRLVSDADIESYLDEGALTAEDVMILAGLEPRTRRAWLLKWYGPQAEKVALLDFEARIA